jgi:4'-phosphopantetheinyl transferase EntD
VIEQLFPAEVVVVTASPADGHSTLRPEEAACIPGVVETRRREFTAGRACARRALARLGIEGFSLVVGPGRAPVWPPDIIGSITHCDGFTAAVVARRGRILAVGVDAEPAIPLDPPLIPLVCTPEERRALAQQPAAESGRCAKVLFSAKEAVHKCLYPVFGLILDFLDVSITLDRDAGRFATARAIASATTLPALGRLEGRFAVTPSHVLSGALLRA